MYAEEPRPCWQVVAFCARPPLQCDHCHSSPTPGTHCGEHLSCERWVFLPTAGSAVTRRTELRGLVQLYACGGGGLILYLLVSCDVGCCSWCNGEIVRYTASGNSRPVATPACRWPVNDLDGEPEALVGLGAVSRESRGHGRDRTVAGSRVAGAEGRWWRHWVSPFRNVAVAGSHAEA